MVKTNWLSANELRAWKNFSLMHLQLTARLAKSLGVAGLSYQDYLVLATLADEPGGRRRIVDLGRDLGWEKSRISHHVSRMCARGLVDKERCPTDQRGSFAVITDYGHAEAVRVAPQHVAEVRDLFVDQLSPTQLATFDRVAESILQHLREVDGLDD